MSFVSNIGSVMIGCILVGLFFGLGVEKYILHQKSALLVVIGVLLGVIAGFFSVYRQILKKLIK